MAIIVNSRRAGLRVSLVAMVSGLILSAIALIAAAAVVPTPDVTGPLASDPPGSAGRNYTFFATDLDLASRGYVEQEFFYAGAANVYDAPALTGGIGLGPAAGTANIVSSGHPYKTRMVVRRPTDANRFNGKVVVEWLNTTGAFDVEAVWFRNHEFLMREGYAWVGISVQDQGISRSPNGLKVWSPTRYGTLDVTDSGTVTAERLSYDVYAQGMQAVRSVPAVMGGLAVKQIIAAGVSQSAGRLALYINAVHPRDPIVDTALLIIGGQQVRTDLDIPVMKVLSETEYVGPSSANQITTLQPDTDRFRLWSQAGVSHSDWQSGVIRYAIQRRDLPALNLYDTCTLPSRSRVRDEYILAAAIDAIGKWIDQGLAPPHSPQFVLTGAPAPNSVARDAYGNALGAIRLASFAVPVALDQGINSGPGTCFLNGTHIPFNTATLNSLYPSHQAYVEAIRNAANQNVRDGFLLKDDAQELIADAIRSVVGMGLDCGPLCQNVAQFVLNPSTTNLRDQTQFYHFVGGAELLATLDQATQWVAQGYTASAQSDAKSQKTAKQNFGRAIQFLEVYINKVQAMEADGRIAPVSAALLIDFANTLIEELEPLA